MKSFKLNKGFYFLFLLAFLVSCGEISPTGDLENKSIEIGEVKEIHLNGKFRLFFVQNSGSAVDIESYPNIIKNLKVKESGGVLSIEEKRPTKDVDFYNVTVFSPVVPKVVKTAGDVEFSISGALKSEAMELFLSGQSKFIGALNLRNLKVEMKESARANFSGDTRDLSMKISDTAHVIAPYLHVKTAEIGASNGPYIELSIEDTLKGDVKGTTHLLFYGDPVDRLKKEKGVRIEKKTLN